LHFDAHRRAKCCDQLSVCLSVCLLARISQKPVQTSPFIHVDVALTRSSSDDSVTRNVLPVLWMTSCFHIMGKVGQSYVWSSSPGIDTMARSLLSPTALYWHRCLRYF